MTLERRGTEDWGECNAAMGFAYADKDVESGEGSQEREDSLDKAISCLNQALTVLTQASHSMQFAEIHDQVHKNSTPSEHTMEPAVIKH